MSFEQLPVVRKAILVSRGAVQHIQVRTNSSSVMLESQEAFTTAAFYFHTLGMFHQIFSTVKMYRIHYFISLPLHVVIPILQVCQGLRSLV